MRKCTVSGNRVSLAVIADDLFCERSAVRRMFTDSSFICGVGRVKNKVCVPPSRPRIYSLGSRGDNCRRFVIDYVHVMHLVTVIA